MDSWIETKQAGAPVRVMRTRRRECSRGLARAVPGLEQHPHRALASRADAEQNIIRTAHVVLDRPRHAAVDDLLRVKRRSASRHPPLSKPIKLPSAMISMRAPGLR